MNLRTGNKKILKKGVRVLVEVMSRKVKDFGGKENPGVQKAGRETNKRQAKPNRAR